MKKSTIIINTFRGDIIKRVIFYSQNIIYKEIKEFIPNETIFVQKFEEAIDKAKSLKPNSPEVSIF